MFAQSRKFTGKSAKRNIEKERFITEVGTFWYYSLILSGFDPVRAETIFDNPADVIAEAYVSMMAFNHVDPDK